MNLAEQYKENNGPNVIRLLTDDSCQDQQGSSCTAEEFFTADTVFYQGVELQKDKNPLAFIELREKFLVSLGDELKGYFPENTFADFEIFVPKFLPRSISEANVYDHKDIQQIARRFNLDPGTASIEWTDLLISMMESEGY